MRVLIVKLSSIGDVVHTLPAAAALRRALPDAHISWVVDRRASEILKDSPAIDELIELDTRRWQKRLLSGVTVRELRMQLDRIRGTQTGGAGATVAIDFQGLVKSGIVALASGATRRIGFETSDLRERASRLFLTEQVPTACISNVIEKNLALARAAVSTESGVSACVGAYEFPLVVAPEDERYVDEAVGDCASGFAIINPGGGWPTKRWQPAGYGQIADWLWSEYGLASFVTYGPGEESLGQEVVERSRAGAAKPIASTLKQFVALARRARLFVGGDTGPLHLAAACGTPIVGLYGPTSPDRNGPFDNRDVTVGRDLWCRSDCHRRKCWHWECMELSVGEVQTAIAKRLAVRDESSPDADQPEVDPLRVTRTDSSIVEPPRLIPDH